jgi:HK97 family phage prohead protease
MTLKIEKRAASEPMAVQGQTIVGYAAVFNSPADIGGMWEEVIAPGAFTDTLRDALNDPLALYSHEVERLLGRRSSGTLRLKEDQRGLAVEIDLPDTNDGRDVGVLVKRGDLKGMSFGFCVTHDEWDETRTPPRRTIHAVDLREVTICAVPAYDDTECGLRSLAEARAKHGGSSGDADARQQAERNAAEARRRIALRKAEQDQKFRGIRPANPRT